MLHAFLAAIGHGVHQAFAFAFALFHVFAGAHGGFQNFQHGDPALAVAARQQALRDDEAESLGEAVADGLLVR